VQFGPWDAATVAIKAAVDAATLAAAGGLFFLCYSGLAAATGAHRRIRRWVLVCAAIAFAATFARIEILAASLADGVAGLPDGALLRLVLSAGEARASGLRLLGLLLTAAIAFEGRLALRTALLGACIAAGSFAGIGHAWAAGNDGLSIVLLTAHLGCVAFWVGAFVPLLIVGRDDAAVFADVVRRFGGIALYAVALLLLAGAALLATLIGSLAALWNTDYGRLMLLKLTGAVLLLAVAAFNRVSLTLKLRADNPQAARSLRRSIACEIALAAAVLIVTAALTSLVGPGGDG
jgi:putative copper export protein